MISRFPLNDNEKKVLVLCNLYEKSIESKVFTVKLLAHIESAQKIVKNYKVLSSVYSKTENKFLINMSIFEFGKYLKECCENVGFEILIDGSVRTKKGDVISLEL